jgi:hypothetical protein
VGRRPSWASICSPGFLADYNASSQDRVWAVRCRSCSRRGVVDVGYPVARHIQLHPWRCGTSSWVGAPISFMRSTTAFLAVDVGAAMKITHSGKPPRYEQTTCIPTQSQNVVRFFTHTLGNSTSRCSC